MVPAGKAGPSMYNHMLTVFPVAGKNPPAGLQKVEETVNPRTVGPLTLTGIARDLPPLWNRALVDEIDPASPCPGTVEGENSWVVPSSNPQLDLPHPLGLPVHLEYPAAHETSQPWAPQTADPQPDAG